MTKMKALHRNKIALFLAVMLMFGALGADVAMACDTARRIDAGVAKNVLEHPKAGEFFTGSLPEGERQSVRETATDWHSIVSVRTGRLSWAKNGEKGTWILVREPDGLHKVTFSGKSPEVNGGISIHRCRKIIVCYIHNQDGAKG